MTLAEFKKKVAARKLMIDDIFVQKKAPHIGDKDIPHDYIQEYGILAGKSEMLNEIVAWLSDVKDESEREPARNRIRG